MRGLRLWLPMVGIALAGCGVQDAARSPPQRATPQRPAAVVADIGPGVNAYHRVFRRESWTEHPCTVLPDFPCDVPALDLTLGDDYAAGVAADAAAWAGYTVGQLYWVPGTNLLLLTTREWNTAPTGNPGAAGAHGTATAASISDACPDCYVLVIQDPQALTGDTLARINERHPWIDFVTTTAPNAEGDLTYSMQCAAGSAFAEQTRTLFERGRLFFAAAGNLPVTGLPALGNCYDTPPWIVTVGGAHGASPIDGSSCFLGATELIAGKPNDFVGRFMQRLPYYESVDDLYYLSGTSFSTPWLAGSFAQALATLRARAGDGHAAGALWSGAPAANPWLEDGRLTAGELREVFRLAARHFAPTDYDADCTQVMVRNTLQYVVPLPASATPWMEMGWGYVDEATVATAVAMLVDNQPPPTRAPDAVLYLQAYEALREQLYP